MATQKSPRSIIKELRKKADKFDGCITDKALLKGNLTASNKALCHFAKLYLDLASFLQDGDDVNTVGINSKHLKTLQQHCTIATSIPDMDDSNEKKQSETSNDDDDDADVIGDIQETQHQDL